MYVHVSLYYTQIKLKVQRCLCMLIEMHYYAHVALCHWMLVVNHMSVFWLAILPYFRVIKHMCLYSHRKKTCA